MVHSRFKDQGTIAHTFPASKNKIAKTSFSKTIIEQKSGNMTLIIKNTINPYYSEKYNIINPITTSPVTPRHHPHRQNKQSTSISLTCLSSSTCISNRSQSHSSPPLRSRISALCFSSNPGNIPFSQILK